MDVEIAELLHRVQDHDFWLSYLSQAEDPRSGIGIHLAIFSEPYLTLALKGTKTVESRFSQNRCAPFGEVAAGDVILIKEVSGPVVGLTIAKKATFYDLVQDSLDSLREAYGQAICADSEFWESRREASFGTLIELAETIPIAPLWCNKRDPRGWVSLRSRQMSFVF